MCRFYGSLPPGPNSHFYTADAAECDYYRERELGWIYEGISFRTDLPARDFPYCAPDRVPIHRLYNRRGAVLDSNHRFVANGLAVADLVAKAPSGDVILVANYHINTLIAFSRKHEFSANHGKRGHIKNQTGASADDLHVQVPIGTVVRA